MAKFKVISTKGLEPSLVERAKEAGIEMVEKDAIQIRAILTREKWNEIFSLLESGIQTAVFTSSNAVDSLKKYLNTYVNYLPVQWKIFCLSGKTKESLLQIEEPFGRLEGTANDATALAHVILAKGVKELVFFCGSRRRDELPAILKRQGVQVHEVVVYETVETPVAVADDFSAVLFFSPSAVHSFFSVNHPKETTVYFAIGQTTADSIKQFTQNKLLISKEPSQEALLQEVIDFFKTA